VREKRESYQALSEHQVTPNRMSQEGGEGISSRKAATQIVNPTEQTASSSQAQSTSTTHPITPLKAPPDEHEHDRKPSAKQDFSSQSTTPSTPEDPPAPRPRQVIAVSASKGPAAFFNLARKFLVTDDMCDLSALEGAIVSAVDAAHLLERSKLATIVKYVCYVIFFHTFRQFISHCSSFLHFTEFKHPMSQSNPSGERTRVLIPKRRQHVSLLRRSNSSNNNEAKQEIPLAERENSDELESSSR
jgi:hypothetical protein